MRLRLDPWSVEMMQASNSDHPLEIYEVENIPWQAVAPHSIPESLSYVYLVDGTRRLDTRVTVETDDVRCFAGFGGYAVGAVELCPHGSRVATIPEHYVYSQKLFVVGNSLKFPQAQFVLQPKAGEGGQMDYHIHSVFKNDPETPLNALHAQMIEKEQHLSSDLSSGIEEVSRTPIQLESVAFQDGRLAQKENPNKLVFGYIKSQRYEYLTPHLLQLLPRLGVGYRTPIFYFRYEGKGYARYSWYVRLAETLPFMQAYGGIMRIEAYAPDEPEDVPPAIQLVANFSGRLLSRLASESYKDARAPQNFIPTGALERKLKNLLGNPHIIAKRVRQYIQEQMG